MRNEVKLVDWYLPGQLMGKELKKAFKRGESEALGTYVPSQPTIRVRDSIYQRKIEEYMN